MPVIFFKDQLKILEPFKRTALRSPDKMLNLVFSERFLKIGITVFYIKFSGEFKHISVT